MKRLDNETLIDRRLDAYGAVAGMLAVPWPTIAFGRAARGGRV